MSQPDRTPRPAVIAVSSHVVRGSVGNRAIVFALQSLGHRVWAVPTLVLPWHPGHGRATRIVPDGDAFRDLMADLERAPWLGEVGGILSGYLGDAGQAEAVARLVGAVRAANPAALYLCDPVIGDAGGLYVPEATARAIRDRLLPLADIATPNRFELGWLTGRAIPDNAAAIAAARSLAPPRVLVTSAHGPEARIGNLLVTRDTALLAEHERAERTPNGTGDLAAALLLARLCTGESDASALAGMAGSVRDAVLRAVSAGADELELEADPASLRHPSAPPAVSWLDGADRQPSVAGIDGCRAGWIAVVREPDGGVRAIVRAGIAELVDSLPAEAVIAVDMPIGLPERIGAGGRGPESLIRPHLGRRQSSVFAIPSRAAVHAERGPFDDERAFRDAHARASAVARATSDPPRAISIQAFALFPKIRELDALLRGRPELRGRIIESHPELAFWRLNGGVAMSTPKKVRGRPDPAGLDERRALLESHGAPSSLLRGPPPAGAGADDLLDAIAMMLVAARHARGETRPFPDPPGRDAFGIPVAIHV